MDREKGWSGKGEGMVRREKGWWGGKRDDGVGGSNEHTTCIFLSKRKIDKDANNTKETKCSEHNKSAQVTID